MGTWLGQTGSERFRPAREIPRDGASARFPQDGTHNKSIDSEALRHSTASRWRPKLRRLDEERPLETAPRTTRLSTQHSILCLRAPRFARCVTSDVSAVSSRTLMRSGARNLYPKSTDQSAGVTRAAVAHRDGVNSNGGRRASQVEHALRVLRRGCGASSTSLQKLEPHRLKHQRGWRRLRIAQDEVMPSDLLARAAQSCTRGAGHPAERRLGRMGRRVGNV